MESGCASEINVLCFAYPPRPGKKWPQSSILVALSVVCCGRKRDDRGFPEALSAADRTCALVRFLVREKIARILIAP